jgi:hypothetical protein
MSKSPGDCVDHPQYKIWLRSVQYILDEKFGWMAFISCISCEEFYSVQSHWYVDVTSRDVYVFCCGSVQANCLLCDRSSNCWTVKNSHWSSSTSWTSAPSGMCLKWTQWQLLFVQYGVPSGVTGQNSSGAMPFDWLRIGAEGRTLEMLLISPARRRSPRAGSGGRSHNAKIDS